MMSRKRHDIVRVRVLYMEDVRLETIKYLSAQEVSEAWGITKRRVQNLCVNERIPGAVRIGNMWAIPYDAKKPDDARLKKYREIMESDDTSIRKARKAIKAVVDAGVCNLVQQDYSREEAIKVFVTLFASALLENYLGDWESCTSICESIFLSYNTKTVPCDTKKAVRRFVEEHKNNLDDALSWVYQLGTKNSSEFPFNDTQFFTEKYMIRTLVDAVGLSAESKVVDPCCGGANFLLYSFEKLADFFADETPEARVSKAMNNLYGYEIDPLLAHIACFNMKLKAIAFISKYHEPTINDFISINPQIYYPQEETVSGFLDIKWDEQIIVCCSTGCKTTLKSLFSDIDTVVTNPPFRTIKGMPKDQKSYLQEHYPLVKCDMCNAFIDRILDVLPEGGKAALVTQNSWMYLDSFAALRERLICNYTVDEIWELGPNAFYNLSGEKANVVLVVFSKIKPSKDHIVKQCLLRDKSNSEIEKILRKKSGQIIEVHQSDIYNNPGARFDMVSTEHLRYLQTNCDTYSQYAVPMQGTSTGDAKNLIDYYWLHLNDENWRLVSKGGGYSRYEGLNSYCVKWGVDGEFIKNTKGSAIRNATYFDRTQLVFSDTGTAGLNVRVLLPGQIFVASGPGIRICQGKTLAHLAFLNSRFAAFYVKLASPKLTIAARYIGQIPTSSNILNSPFLEEKGKQCLEAKKNRLAKRPSNIEFEYCTHKRGKTIDGMATEWFLEDVNDEWAQLMSEDAIERFINKELDLSDDDIHAINSLIGNRKIIADDENDKDSLIEESEVKGLLKGDGSLKRIKANQNVLGSDGLIEYLSKAKNVSCKEVYSILSNNPEWFKNEYTNLYMHALVLSAMKYKSNDRTNKEINDLIKDMGISEESDRSFAEKWIETHFNNVHDKSFDDRPILRYDQKTRVLSWIVR